jgi:hypothetical protein
MIDDYIEAVLGADTALLSYLSKNINAELLWRERPPSTTVRPIVRWWKRTDGLDTMRQDGVMGRAMSNPEYIVCVLDQQDAEQVDRVYGSYGLQSNPPVRYFQMAALRIYEDLHAYTYIDANSFSYTAFAIRPYTSEIAMSGGTYEVCVGYVFQLRVS